MQSRFKYMLVHQMLPWFALIACSIAVWLDAYSNLRIIGWSTPVYTKDDALGVLGTIRAYQNGEIGLWTQKFVSHLGAPYSANWNDYPVTEDVIYWATGLLARAIGLGVAVNVVYMLTYVAAACAFYFAVRRFEGKVVPAFCLALLFAFSEFHFYRSIEHFAFSHYWHLPLHIWSLASLSKRLPNVRTYDRWLNVLIALITGMLNTYFILPYALGLVWLGVHDSMKTSVRESQRYAWILFAMTATFLLAHVDSISYWMAHGFNTRGVHRNSYELSTYGMRVSDWFFAPDSTRFTWLTEFSLTHYHQPVAKVFGEARSAYLGCIGVLWLLWILIRNIKGVLRRGAQGIDLTFASIIAMVVLFSTGGVMLLVNSLIGSSWIRGTNRYSIIISLICYLDLAMVLSRMHRQLVAWACAAVFTVVGIYEVLPRYVHEEEAKRAQHVQEDQRLGAFLDGHFANKRIFQLPVMGYPENAPIYKMRDYEHLRPYLFTQLVFYSYGSDRGRQTADWQSMVGQLPVHDMVNTLERYGFSALLINRKGFADEAFNIVMLLRDYRRYLQFLNADFAVVALHASAKPVPPEFDDCDIAICHGGTPHVVGECQFSPDDGQNLMVGPEGQAGTLWFGPYMRLDSGRYHVRFNLTADAPSTATDRLGMVDVFNKTAIVTSAPIAPSSKRQEIVLPFTHVRSKARYEFRVLTNGQARLRVHYIALCRDR